MAGMPEPPVVKTLKSRTQQIDDAEAAAVGAPKPVKTATPAPGAPDPTEKRGFLFSVRRALGMTKIGPDGKDE